jgi:hypothetical protein
VRFASTGIGSGGAVALEHGAGLPPGDTHQIRLGATLGQPLVGERVAELVRVERWHLRTPAGQHHH